MKEETAPVDQARAVTPFTVKQGEYLAFIDQYSRLHGMPPAESDFRRFFKVTAPVVHQMITTLHARGFIDREPGKPRSITLRLSRAQLPDLPAHSALGRPLLILNSGTGMSATRPGENKASRREEPPADRHSIVKGASRSKPRGARWQPSCLDVLTAEEAAAVLHALLEAHPALLPDARQAADSLLATVSFSDVAEKVSAGLQALGLEDLDAGPRASGYVELSEAAWYAIESVVASYLHDLERRVKLRHDDEALEVCSGIVMGLYRAEHTGFELHAYAEDAPSELAGRAVGIWRRHRRRCPFPRHFVEKFTPDWNWLAD
jgi:DNA-binding MarR family transcriptional regulator